MSQPNLSDATDVGPAQDFTVAIAHQSMPSETGTDCVMPLADVPALIEHRGVA
jgi:hypothetical protein